MTDTVITVQGTFSVKHAPERATVSVSVSHDGPRREPVFAATTEVAAAITRPLQEWRDAASGPVSTWSSERVGVWSERPWNAEGKQLPLVYHAVLGVEATFVDFDALARWVETLATTAGVTVSSIDWALQDATRDRLLEEVRTKAVQDAAAKALVYARAAGLTSVTATSIADPGLLEDADIARGGMMAASSPRLMKASANLEFTPAELEIEARVDARFLAR